MKIIALILSQILFLNEGFSRLSSLATFRLELEKKIFEGVELWNQAKDYSQIVDNLNATKAEKALLKKLVQEEGLEKTKPVHVDFIAREHKLNVKFKGGPTSIWILAVAPSIVTYDGKQVSEFFPKSKVGDYFSKSKNKKKFSKIKRTSFLWQVTFPEARAQFVTPEQQIEWEAKLKKEADRQSSLVKKILLVTLFSFVGFLGIFWLWGKFAHHLNPTSDVDGAATVQKHRELARENYPDIERTLFSTEEPLDYFECESADKSSALRLVRFKGKDQSKIEFNIGNGSYKLPPPDTAKDTNALKVEKAEYCCQHHPCGGWLSLRLIGEVPDIYESEKGKNSGEQ